MNAVRYQSDERGAVWRDMLQAGCEQGLPDNCNIEWFIDAMSRDSRRPVMTPKMNHSEGQ